MSVTVGQSLTRLRAFAGDGTLNEQLRLVLDDVDPGWGTNFYDSLWVEGEQALRSFVAREGHARPSQTHVENGFPLGKWVANRRLERRRSQLSAQRQTTLESYAGWIWEPFADQFAEGVAHLDSFILGHGVARVPRHYTVDGFPLGAWCDRRRIDRERGRLGADRIATLEARSGWEWRPADADYERALTLLRQYTAREGHSRVPRAHAEDGMNLGYWVAARRRDQRAGKLSSDRAAELGAVPGWAWSAAR